MSEPCAVTVRASLLQIDSEPWTSHALRMAQKCVPTADALLQRTGETSLGHRWRECAHP